MIAVCIAFYVHIQTDGTAQWAVDSTKWQHCRKYISAWLSYEVILWGVAILWTGPLGWTTGLTFDPQILDKIIY